MEIGYIGLGKMGYNMVERMLEKGHTVYAYNRNQDLVKEISKKGARPCASPAEMVKLLAKPRLVWLMVSHQAVDVMIDELIKHLEPGDTIIDGGNSPYTESIRRGKSLEEKGIGFLDAGVSGGPGGARNGACIMVGGREELFRRYEPLFNDLTVEGGYRWFGKQGAGHFVKMVHNGIEYGMMQAIAEGFAVMKASDFNLDLTKVADLYNHKSVVESRLVGWLKEGFERYGEDLKGVSGSVAYTGEGEWTVDAAKKLDIPVPVIEESLNFRIESEEEPSYTGQLLSVMRGQFGQHSVKKEG